MENSVQALKMSFAVMVFATALSITFFLLSQMNETADSLLAYSDKTNYWVAPMSGEESRIVGIDTVISTLKNRGLQTSYVTIIENGSEDTFTLTETDEEKQRVENFIKEHILHTNAEYKETIREITTDGTYMTASDMTRISVKPGGATRRYIIYEKQ